MDTLQLTIQPTGEGSKKIPQAVFIEKVEEYVKKYTAERLL